MEISENRWNENWAVCSVCYSKGVSLHHWRSEETQRRKESRKLLSLKKKKRSFRVCSAWRWLAWRSQRCASQKPSILWDWSGGCLAFHGWSRVGQSNDKKKKNHQLSIKSCPFWYSCFQDWILAPGLVALEVEVRLLFLSMVWTLSICIFSPSEVLVPTIV